MSEKNPSFSIIIPTFNREQQLTACLQSLAHLEYPGDSYEVIVVDDGSSAPPESMINRFKQRMNVRLIIQPHSGPAAARNTGAAQAEGKFIAFTDDDCAPQEGWLQAMAVALSEAPDVIIGGRTINQIPDNVYATASQLLIDYLHSYYNAKKDRARFLTSNNMAVAADRFREFGGFDTSFPIAAAEDRELCDRWLDQSFRLHYVPEAVVYHAHALALRSFLRQHFNYGCGACHFHDVRRHRKNQDIQVESLSFYLNLLKYPFSCGQGRHALLLLLVASQFANIAGYFTEIVRKRFLQER